MERPYSPSLTQGPGDRQGKSARSCPTACNNGGGTVSSGGLASVGLSSGAGSTLGAARRRDTRRDQVEADPARQKEAGPVQRSGTGTDDSECVPMRLSGASPRLGAL